MRPITRKLLDFALLQVGWCVCVMGGAAGNQWIGPLSVAVFVTAHVGWIAPRGTRARELRNCALFGLAGSALDVAQVRLGALCFADSPWNVAGIPLWIVTLWCLFPILFNSAFQWLHGRPWLAAGTALIGAPLTYRAGAELGAVRIGTDSWASLASLAVAWAVYLPLALHLGRDRDPAR